MASFKYSAPSLFHLQNRIRKGRGEWLMDSEVLEMSGDCRPPALDSVAFLFSKLKHLTSQTGKHKKMDQPEQKIKGQLWPKNATSQLL